ncbi:3-hydroxyacyl-[acyl-carrier-protein] dehydratase FabZ [Piscirickettsia salmonis]|uniref:3-hydroxyacyl-[acyl-carrier-protein] dehydratase FabZ n=3 Tax=Piscirickettsia salmonis TaxID=1238 RepID=A0A1L6T9Q5_PISSA|nr:beta-hydroxyacyl-ACP dehydratase [Piscirickettsia salmonis LF-89 = ATCC VR-1361]ALB21914.1 Beta-hydroxyacyl-(acyl-carrier-protein) dehydratase FabZ [Piscirickettsia salmonis]OAJ35475.1 3-hydroxyacyl-[acyl-carrier-protein] dehydratase FabZ [Piscirickettsiaceae bacterium NZ-RLO1]ALY02084.1 3-hydroxyacyl-[acyl-carrier-protein] dehydratase FabZ [Piscirickettsia salmonis]AMA41597.1 3-hydroxyacyl-[acyl-carrier-protein] dehydratase FabZ [Piscirickettsia salmonis]
MADEIDMDKMDIQAILEHLPHRYPFLLIDRVLSLEPEKSLVAIKNVTINEPYFQGHFPKYPVMPGVLIVEALAQATGVLAFKSMGVLPGEKRIFLLAGVDNTRFKQPVLPGDQLHLEVEIVSSKRNIFKFKAQAKVDGKLVCSAEMMGAYKEVQ